VLPCSDLLSTAILGPWLPSGPGGTRGQQVFLSLAHWYEAAKFMPHRPELGNALLFSPSIKEARKFARMQQASWRSDWPLARCSVLVAGLGLLALQRPELGLRRCALDLVKAELASLQLPEQLVQTCLQRFEAWRRAPRLCVLGADGGAPTSVVGARLAKLVASMPQWTLVTTCHRRTPWRVHDWALQQFVPVEYHGTPSMRPSRHLARAVIEASDQVVVFEQRQQKRFDRVLQLAKGLRKKVSLELYDAGAETAIPLALD
jgi:hypothetical protein